MDIQIGVWPECLSANLPFTKQPIAPKATLVFVRNFFPENLTQFLKVWVQAWIAAKHPNDPRKATQTSARLPKLLWLHKKHPAELSGKANSNRAILTVKITSVCHFDLKDPAPPNAGPVVPWSLHFMQWDH